MEQTGNPIKTYLGVYAALLVLLVITVGVATINLGPYNLFIAMTVSVIKAVLVLLYFMHVRTSNRMIWVFAGAGFFWFLLAMVLMFTDYLTRGM